MSIHYPQDESSFRQINGVGENKMARFGNLFISIIKKYCKEHNIGAKPKPAQISMQSYKTIGKKRFQEIGEEFCNGKTIKQITKELNIKKQTVVRHLYTYVNEGNAIPGEPLLLEVKTNESFQEKALDLFKEMGTEFLSPVYEKLGEKVEFDDLHVLRVYAINEKISH